MSTASRFLPTASEAPSSEAPFTLWQLKVIQEVVSLSVFTVFALVFMKSDTLRWNHLAGFICLIMAVYFIFRK